MDKVALMDGGSLLFLLVALLGVVADWIGKRRKARAQESSMPVAPVRRSTPSASQEAPHSSQPSPRAYRHWKNPQPSPASQPSGLFERLQDELRKVAEAAEISEVIDERPKAPAVVPPPLPKPPPTRPSGGPPSKVRSTTPSKTDLDRAASLVEKATRELEAVKSQRPSRRLKTSAQRGGVVSFASTRRSLRDPSQLRQAIILQTILEPPKSLQAASQGESF
ncbi:MAG: hypothetical protein VYE02_04235 [Verrucomicrobiota bacterium]|nr:hypothetical protein [Verrucomicrobiota bacterium]